jgi:hypothetical protein
MTDNDDHNSNTEDPVRSAQTKTHPEQIHAVEAANRSTVNQVVISESFMDLANNVDYNCMNETILLEDGTTQSLIRFENECDNKNYIELKEGVYVRATDDSKGTMRIHKQHVTTLTEHETDINYFIMRGFVVFTVNNSKHLMKCGDFITIPKCKCTYTF